MKHKIFLTLILFSTIATTACSNKTTALSEEDLIHVDRDDIYALAAKACIENYPGDKELQEECFNSPAVQNQIDKSLKELGIN